MMDTFALMGFVFGIFGLLAFAQVRQLRKQVYLLRLDVRNAGYRVPEEHSDDEGSCGCGGTCGCGGE